MLNAVTYHVLVLAYAAHEVSRRPNCIFVTMTFESHLNVFRKFDADWALNFPMTSAIECFGGIIISMCK